MILQKQKTKKTVLQTAELKKSHLCRLVISYRRFRERCLHMQDSSRNSSCFTLKVGQQALRKRR